MLTSVFNSLYYVFFTKTENKENDENITFDIIENENDNKDNQITDNKDNKENQMTEIKTSEIKKEEQLEYNPNVLEFDEKTSHEKKRKNDCKKKKRSKNHKN
jgi:type IV secretory pathway VirB10-like protein